MALKWWLVRRKFVSIGLSSFEVSFMTSSGIWKKRDDAVVISIFFFCLCVGLKYWCALWREEVKVEKYRKWVNKTNMNRHGNGNGFRPFICE